MKFAVSVTETVSRSIYLPDVESMSAVSAAKFALEILREDDADSSDCGDDSIDTVQSVEIVVEPESGAGPLMFNEVDLYCPQESSLPSDVDLSTGLAGTLGYSELEQFACVLVGFLTLQGGWDRVFHMDSHPAFACNEFARLCCEGHIIPNPFGPYGSHPKMGFVVSRGFIHRINLHRKS